MKTWHGAGAFLLGALILEGCAASATQGAQVRVRTTTAAYAHDVPSQAVLAQRLRKPEREGSPLVHACKAGSSKACNELGDRLAIKHAYPEARQWYTTSCERVRASMLPTAERMMQLSQDVAANPGRMAALKSDVTEIRARIQGCLDAGEMLKADEELKQSLTYYDAVCEFSTLVELVGESVAGLQHVTESGCAAGQSARAKLSNRAPFTPQLFANLATQQRAAAAAKQEPQQAEAEMVFSAGDL